MTPRALLRTGYDFAQQYRVELNGSLEDLSTATIKASLKSRNKATELIADTAQANSGGADWANGVVEIVFGAAATALLITNNLVTFDDSGNADAFIELSITKSATRLPCPDIPVVVQRGHTLS